MSTTHAASGRLLVKRRDEGHLHHGQRVVLGETSHLDLLEVEKVKVGGATKLAATVGAAPWSLTIHGEAEVATVEAAPAIESLQLLLEQVIVEQGVDSVAARIQIKV